MKGVGAVILLLGLASCSPRPDVLTISTDVATAEAPDGAVHPLSDAGIWSASSVLLRDKPVFSPDGRFMLQWTEQGISISGEAHGLLAPRGMGDAPPEILWSAQGNYVAITWSDDTAIPAWSIDAYYLGNGTPREIGIDSVFHSQATTAKGISGVVRLANYAAVAWLDDEHSLLFVVEQSLNGSWMNGSALRALKYSIPDDKIVETLEGDDLLAAYGRYLGPRVLRELKR